MRWLCKCTYTKETERGNLSHICYYTAGINPRVWDKWHYFAQPLSHYFLNSYINRTFYSLKIQVYFGMEGSWHRAHCAIQQWTSLSLNAWLITKFVHASNKFERGRRVQSGLFCNHMSFSQLFSGRWPLVELYISQMNGVAMQVDLLVMVNSRLLLAFQ